MLNSKKIKQVRNYSSCEEYKILFESDVPPQEPKRRPKVIVDLTKPLPDTVKTAGAFFTLAALSTYYSDTRFTYWDGTAREPRMNAVVVAPSGGLKSFVGRAIKAILKQIEEEDNENWAIDMEYRKEKEAAGNTRTKNRPDVVIRLISPNITKPELNQLGAAANGQYLFMHANETDKLDTLKGGKNGRQHFEILKNADDEENTAGQQRAGINSVSVKYDLRLNYVFEMRPTELLRFYNGEIINGARDRACFCTIPPLENKHQWPRGGDFGAEYQQLIAPYIENVKSAKGEYVYNKALDLINHIREAFLEFYDETQDDILEQITHRALLRAFRRTMIIYIAGNKQWDPALSKWIKWSFMYELWHHYHFFYLEIKNANGQLKVTNQGVPNFLDMLPDEFTLEDVALLYVRIGKTPQKKTIQGIIRTWKNRGHITISKNICKKVN